MPSSGYVTWSVVFGEQPTATKWNELGTNDASFNNGNGFNDSILIERHFADSAVTSRKRLMSADSAVYGQSTTLNAGDNILPLRAGESAPQLVLAVQSLVLINIMGSFRVSNPTGSYHRIYPQLSFNAAAYADLDATKQMTVFNNPYISAFNNLTSAENAGNPSATWFVKLAAGTWDFRIKSTPHIAAPITLTFDYSMNVVNLGAIA